MFRRSIYSVAIIALLAGVAAAQQPTVSVSFSPTSIPLNGTSTLTVTVGSPAGPGNSFFSTLLPTGLVFTTPSVITTSPAGCNGAVSAPAGSRSFSYNSSSLTCTITVTVKGITIGSKFIFIDYIDWDDDEAFGSASLTVTAPPLPPVITAGFSVASIPLSGNAPLNVSIHNPNASTLTGVGFSDALPSGLQINSAVTGTCGGGTIGAVIGSSLLSLANATLAGSATCAFSVVVLPTSLGVKNNSVTVNSTEGGSGNTSTSALTVVAPPSISEAFGGQTVALGGSTSLTFTITNPNAGTTLTGVAFTDSLPGGLAVASALSNTCGGTLSASGTNLTLSGGSIPSASSCSVAVSVTGTTGGFQSNMAAVIADQGTGNTASASIIVALPPTISKAFGTSVLPAGNTTSLSFTISNPGSGVLTGIGFSDSLPSGLVVASVPNLTSNCQIGTITATAGATGITLSGGALGPIFVPGARPGEPPQAIRRSLGQASCTFSVDVNASAAGVKNNVTTNVTSTEGGAGNAASATLNVGLPPVITKSFGAATIPLNGSTTLNFLITNPSGSLPVSGIGFTDTLPSGLLVAASPDLAGNCGGGTISATGGASSVSLAGATLGINASCSFTISVTGNTAGIKSNSVQVSSSSGGTGNTSTASLRVLTPPTMSKSFSGSTVAVGGSATLSFTIGNSNLGFALTSVGFADHLPSGLSVASPNGLTSTSGCGAGTVTATAGTTTVSLAGAAVGDSACTFSVNVLASTRGVKNNITDVVVSAEGGTGGTAAASITAFSQPTISKVFGDASIPLNGTTTLSFTVSNPNTSPLTGVSFSDSLPAGLVVASPNGLLTPCGTPSTITANAGSSSISFSAASMGSGPCTFSVNVTGTTSGMKNNVTGNVTSEEGGAGNTASASLLVASPATITKTFGAATIPLNGSTTLSFALNNPNASLALAGVAFTDSLPAGLTIDTPSGLSGSCGGGTITAIAGSSSVTLTGATMAASASCSISVNVTGATAGVKNNTVTTSSTTAGAGIASNATLGVIAPPAIGKAFDGQTIALGAGSPLTFTLTNSNVSALSGVGFIDNLPAGLVVSSPNGLSGNCGAGLIVSADGASSIVLTGGTIAGSSACTFSVNVTGATAGVKNNTTGNVTSTEGGTGGTASASLTVLAPPTIVKSFGAPLFAPGGTTSLTFTITNPNQSGTLFGVGFTDVLPAGLAVATPNVLTGTCDSGSITATPGSSSVTLAGASIAVAVQFQPVLRRGGSLPLGQPSVSGSCTFSINVTSAGPTTGVRNNSVTVTSSNGGAGNTSNASVIVIGAPSISKAFGAATIPLNSSTSLSFTITNANATSSLSGIGLTDALPAGLIVSTPNGLTGNCGAGSITAVAGSSNVSLAAGSLAAAASCTFSISVTGTTAGLKSNVTSNIVTTETGTGVAASASLVVVAPPTISKVFGAGSIVVNETARLSFTINNPNASATLNGVSFIDPLPLGLIVATPNGLSSTCGEGAATAVAGSLSVSLSGATIPPGSCTIFLDVLAKTPGTKLNTTAAITSANGGTGNAASASLIVAPPLLSISTTSLPDGKAGQPYSATVLATGGIAPYSFTASGLPAAVSMLTNGQILGTPIAPGTFSVALTASDSGGNHASASITLVILSGNLQITSSGALGEFAAGASISRSSAATGGKPPYIWSATGLPTGFNFDSASGAFSGSAPAPGAYAFTLGVIDSQSPPASASISVTFSVFGITTGSLSAATKNSAYSQTLTATGGVVPYSFSASGLPAGLALSSAGLLSGTPTQSGTFGIAISATDANGVSASASLSLVVNGPISPLNITGGALPGSTILGTYSAVLQGNGGTAPYTWSLAGGALPDGLSLDPTGAIQGSPKKSGTFTFTVQVTDSTHATASATYTITIAAESLKLTAFTFPTGVVGGDYPLQILGATGGTPPYVFAITGGTLPAGLSFVSPQFSGITTAAGTSAFTVSVTDSLQAKADAPGSILINPAHADLVLSQSQTGFLLTVGSGGLPAPASVTVRSSDVLQLLHYTVGVTPSAPWLVVTGGGTTPGEVGISLDPSAQALAPGVFSSVINVACVAPSSCAGNIQPIMVTLAVTAPPPQLTLTNSLLSFEATVPNPTSVSQPIGIQNTGGGTLTVKSVTGADSWVTISGAPASVQAGPPVAFTVTASPAGLDPGYHNSSLTVDSSAGSSTIPVVFLIPSKPFMNLAPAGTQFTMSAGGALGNASGTFQVSTPAAGAVGWNAAVLPGASWLQATTAGGTSTAASPGAVSFAIDNASAAALAAGTYYGAIRVISADVIDSPLDFGVVLNVIQAGALVAPSPSPAGLVFASQGTGSRNITVFASSTASLPYQASAATDGDLKWLSVSPATGSASSTAPGQSAVSIDATGLAAGIYRGGVSYAFSSAAVRTVNVTLIVGSVSTPSFVSSAVPNAVLSCTRSALAPTEIALASNFQQLAGWPVPLSVNLLDNCGAAVTGAQVIASFSNGDPPLELSAVDNSSGVYTATWTPQGVSSQVTVRAKATAAGLGSATIETTGQVSSNSSPILTQNGVGNIFYPTLGGALAPGGVVEILGTNLAARPATATSAPLDTQLGGTSVLIGGIAAPLFYVSPGQINAQTPFELLPGARYQVQVRSNGASSTPESVQIEAVAPALAVQTNGQVIAQHSDYSLVAATSPAKPGELLVIYLAGMGATDKAILSGAAAPVSPFIHPMATPTLSLSGSRIPISFSGLTPLAVGLYQINFQVPTGTPDGDLELVVSQMGASNNTTSSNKGILSVKR